MEKDKDPNYENNTDTSLVLSDDRFNSAVQEIMKEALLEGATPLASALEADISTNLFNSWYQIETFKNWVDGLVVLHLSRKRRNSNVLIDKIEEGGDLVKAAELTMKYLTSADKEFGSRHQKITTDPGDKRVLTPESRSKVDKAMEDTLIVKEAEKLANEPDNS